MKPSPEMLRSDDERDFMSALGTLLSMPKQEAIDILKQLAVEPSGIFRSRAIDGMVKISPEQAELLAIQLLNDPQWFVRVNAIDALRKLGSRATAPLIAHRLSTDPDESVRSWAAFALGQLGDSSAIPALMNAAEMDTGADHEGRPIRETAINSIKMIKSRLAE